VIVAAADTFRAAAIERSKYVRCAGANINNRKARIPRGCLRRRQSRNRRKTRTV